MLLRRLVLAAALCAAGTAHALTLLGVQEPPGSFLDDQGTAQGLSVDIVREIQQRVGNRDHIRIVSEIVALDRARSEADVVVFSFSRTPEREAQFHWITQVIRKPWVLYGVAASRLDVGSVDDMRRVTAIGVVEGDVRAQWLQQQGFANLRLADSPVANLRALLEGRVQAIFTEPQGVAWYCREIRCAQGVVRMLYSPRASDVYILMSRQGTNPATAKAWQDAAAALKADGTFDRLARQWALKAALDYGVDSYVKDGVLNFR